MDYLASKNRPYRFVGSDEHLSSLKTGEKAELFLGEKCGGEMAPLFAACRALIDLGTLETAFPQKALQCLSSGRPVIALGDPLRREFLPLKGTFFTKSDPFDWSSFHVEMEQLEENVFGFDSQKLHQSVRGFHEAGFKARFRRYVQKNFS